MHPEADNDCDDPEPSISDGDQSWREEHEALPQLQLPDEPAVHTYPVPNAPQPCPIPSPKSEAIAETISPAGKKQSSAPTLPIPCVDVDADNDDDVILVNTTFPTPLQAPRQHAPTSSPISDSFEREAGMAALKARAVLARRLVKERHRQLSEASAALRLVEDAIAVRHATLRRAADAAFDWNGNCFAWDTVLAQNLRHVFDITSFRPLQREALNATLLRRDVFAILPTGAGKSLIYQLAAVVDRGLTLVISPLLSLSMDQKTALRHLNINAQSLDSTTTKDSVHHIYEVILPKNGKVMQSSQPRKKKRKVQKKCQKNAQNRARIRDGKWIPDDMPTTILFVTPEQVVRSKRLMNRLEMMYEEGHLSRIVVDEAHCCSSWGHDFRSDYRKLGILKRQCPETPILALSATSSPETTDDVCKTLEVPNTVVFRGSIDRPNIFYEVRRKQDDEDSVIADIAAFLLLELKGQCGIIYVLSRKETEVYSENLKASGIRTGCYHGDMDREERNRIHEQWQSGRLLVVVATIAFGLGIDNQNVRFVIHATMAASLEGYYQESGRAGRDGKPAKCILLHRPKDFARLSSFVADKGDSRLSKMYDMYRYATGRRLGKSSEEQVATCRRAVIAAAFNETPPHRSEHERLTCCDLCAEGTDSPCRPILVDVSVLAKSLLNIMIHLNEKRSNEKITILALATAWGNTGEKGKRMRGDEPVADRRISLTVRLEIIIGLIFYDALQEYHRHTSHAVNAYVTIGPSINDAYNDCKKFYLVMQQQNAKQLALVCTAAESTGQT